MASEREPTRITRIVDDLAEFTGLDPAEVRRRMAGGIAQTASAYQTHEGPPETFYAETDAYLFELAAYEDDRSREALAERVGRAAPGATLLEYGCGIGTQAVRFAEAGLHVFACDANRHNSGFLAFRARKHPWGARLRVLPVTQSLGGDLTYDYISCQHVLEHLEAPRAYLRRFYVRLRPGGYFLGVAPFGLVGPDFPEHRVEHADLRLEDLCAETGFTIVQTVEFGSHGSYPFRLVVARKPV